MVASRKILLGSKLELKIRRKEILHAYCLRNRPRTGRITFRVSYEPYFNRHLDASSVFIYGQPGYTVQNKSPTSAGKRFLPSIVFSYFVCIQSEEALYKMFYLSLLKHFLQSRQCYNIDKGNSFTIVSDTHKWNSRTASFWRTYKGKTS